MFKYISKILLVIGISLISLISYSQFGDDMLEMSNAKVNNTFIFRGSTISGITIGDSFPTTDWVDLRIKGSATTEQVHYNIGGSVHGFGQVIPGISIFAPTYDMIGMSAKSYYMHSYPSATTPTYSFSNALNFGFNGRNATSFGCYYNGDSIFIVYKDSLQLNKPIKGSHGLMTTVTTTSLINSSILNIPSALKKVTTIDTVVVIDHDSLKYYIFDLELLADTNYVLAHQSIGGGGTGDVSVSGTPTIGQLSVWVNDTTITGVDSVTTTTFAITDSLYLTKFAGGVWGTRIFTVSNSGALDTIVISPVAGFMLDPKFKIPSIKEHMKDKINGEISWWFQDMKTGEIRKVYGLKDKDLTIQNILTAFQSGIEMSKIHILQLTKKINILYIICTLLTSCLICQQIQISKLKRK